MGYCIEIFWFAAKIQLKKLTLKKVVVRPQRYEEFYSGTVWCGIFAISLYIGIFRYGTYNPYIFISGFFGNCSVFFDISLLVHSVINLEFFHNCVSFCHQNITKESENMFEGRVVLLMKMSVCQF